MELDNWLKWENRAENTSAAGKSKERREKGGFSDPISPADMGCRRSGTAPPEAEWALRLEYRARLDDRAADAAPSAYSVRYRFWGI